MSAPRFPLGGLLIILGCQFLGMAIAALSGIPVPGTVLGMLIFFAYLQWQKPGLNASSVRAADGLLANMQLFFIPPGVGILAHFALLRAEWGAALGGLFAGWAAAHVVTAVVAVAMLRLFRRRATEAEA
ncbi:CidA/LrgA family protein [Granulicoccus sp. GXG6511]|uniref:CidA/LrgA family protein n=1 Tax=Granulicoccus sp. GXG6511 TaxID=3381351 RepID=UPI003D7E2987